MKIKRVPIARDDRGLTGAMTSTLSECVLKVAKTRARWPITTVSREPCSSKNSPSRRRISSLGRHQGSFRTQQCQRRQRSSRFADGTLARRTSPISLTAGDLRRGEPRWTSSLLPDHVSGCLHRRGVLRHLTLAAVAADATGRVVRSLTSMTPERVERDLPALDGACNLAVDGTDDRFAAVRWAT